MSFEKENDFSLVKLDNNDSSLKESQNEFIESDLQINEGNDFIELQELKVLDDHLDLLKKKISALEMWKTVNESTSKLCLGNLVADSNFALDESNLIFLILSE